MKDPNQGTLLALPGQIEFWTILFLSLVDSHCHLVSHKPSFALTVVSVFAGFLKYIFSVYLFRLKRLGYIFKSLSLHFGRPFKLRYCMQES